MNEEAYVARRQVAWARLRQLTDKADTTPRALSAPELKEFVALYREAASDLATVRTRSANAGLVAFLNDLCGRSYSVLYRAPRRRLGAAIAEGIVEIARTGRRLALFALASFVVLFGTAFLAYFLLRAGTVPLEAFVPGGGGRNFESWKSGTFEGRTADESINMTGLYAANNPLVALFTAAVSVGTMGLYSLVLLYQNGAMAGALAHETATTGHLDFFLSSIFPHGVPEISGIVLAGAVALRVGWAILSPGVYSRGESLRLAGRDVGIGLLASVLLMFIAAPIEGFFSFNPAVPGWLKTTVGCFELVLAGLFWTRVGREDAPASERAEGSGRPEGSAGPGRRGGGASRPSVPSEAR